MHRPNVLVLVPHDLGDFLGCYGHDTVKSPNLDRMAEDGVRFSHYFTAAPECTPSRAGMYTGLYTHQNGLMGLTHRGWEFNKDAVHLAQRLWDAGYDTHLFGYQHETWFSPARLGYNHTHAQQDRNVGRVCRELAQFLASDSAGSERPWFVCAGFHDVHRPWKEQSSFRVEDIQVPPYLPDNDAVRRDVTHFHQNIFEMDEAVGTVLEALRTSGLEQNTIAIFTTDHGAPFPRAKSTFYDPGIRIPLIMQWRGHVEGGPVHGDLLSNLDFTPTILDICGWGAPDGLEGRSFEPLLRGQPCGERDAVFGALYYDASYDPMHCVRTKTHKYIRSFGLTPEEAARADPAVLAGHETGIWIRADDSDVQRSPAWQSMSAEDHPLPPAEELYDLVNDPIEQINLAGDPSAAGILADMRRRMQAMMERTNSPLLNGAHVSPDLSRTRNSNMSVE